MCVFDPFTHLWPWPSPKSHSHSEPPPTNSCVHAHSLSHVWLLVTPWTVAHQAPLSMGFSSMKTGVGCHFLLQGIFSTRGSNPRVLHLLHWQADSLPLVPPGKPHLATAPASKDIVFCLLYSVFWWSCLSSEDKPLQYTYGSARKDVFSGTLGGGKHPILPRNGKRQIGKKWSYFSFFIIMKCFRFTIIKK